MLSKRTKLLACVSPFSLLMLATTPADAQPAAASEPAIPAEQATAIDEVIVTARRREERLQDVPAAITAYSAKDLSRYATGTVEALATQTPQLNIGPTGTPAGASISIRGVGTSATTPSVDQSVSLNIDGIQISQANAIKLGIYALERVEILKGPQALFYGKNSPGGVISLVSADPTDEFEWRLRTGYEFKNAQKFAEEMVSIPLTEGWALRLDAYQSQQDGWFRNTANADVRKALNQKEYFVRGTLRYVSPDERFDSRLKVAIGSLDQAGGTTAIGQLFACPFGIPQGAAPGSAPCGLGRYVSNADMRPAVAATNPYWGDGRLFFENRQFLTSWTTNYQVADDLTLTSVTGYYQLNEKWDGNFSGGFGEALFAGTQTQVHQFTQELRLLSTFDSPLNFLVGAFYQKADLDLYVPFAFAGLAAASIFGPGAAPVLMGNDLFDQETEAYSAFGQLLWKFDPQWEVTVGGRYSHEEKSVEGTRLPSLTSGFRTLPIPFASPGLKFNNFSPEATLSYYATPELTVYAAYRTGFTSGGYNLIPNLAVAQANDATFEQSTVDGGEFGVKGFAFNRQLQFEVTAYKYGYKDLQLTAFEPQSLAFTVKNAGSSTVQGVEVNLVGRPADIPDLTLRAALAYNDAHYDSYPDAGCYAGQTQALGCNGAVINGVASTQDLSGRQLLQATEWSGNIGATYDRPIGDKLNLSLSADANYIGPFFSQLEADPRSRQDEAWRFNASIALRDRDDAWELALVGRNLSNELRVVRSSSQPLTGRGTGGVGPATLADLQGSVTEPRTIMLQLKIRSSIFK